MLTFKKNLFTLIIALGFIQIANAQTNWVADKNHTNIRFTALHYVITEVEGEFKEFDATVVSNNENFDGADVDFSAKVASINTDNDNRDNHLKSDDFFNAEQYPEITFKGKIQKESDKYYLVGDFTMRDVTKSVKFDVKFNGIADLGDRGKKAGFKVTGTVDRYEYNIKFDRALETGGLVVSQEIDITCNIELNMVK